MFWRTKQKKNVRHDRRKKLLRLETLESRQMLTGIVNVITMPALFPAALPLAAGVAAPAAGDVVLTSDGHNNNILMTPTGPGAFTVAAPTSGETLFSLNGAPAVASVPLSGITNVFVWTDNIAAGADTFDMQPTGSTPVLAVPGNLNIIDGNTAITVNNVMIGGGLNVYSDGKLTSSSVTVKGSTVAADSFVDMDPLAGIGVGPNASTNVVISGSTFADALLLNYAPGSNSTSISATTIGPGFGTALTINNPAGGSNTLFGTTAAVTINGGLTVTNGANPTASGEPNVLSFNNTTVQGAVGITDAGGDSYITVLGSTLGANLAAVAAQTTVQNTGGPTTTDPAAGVSSFFAGALTGSTVKDAAFPHGLYIDNAAPTATTNAAKNITILDQTYVGEDQAGDLTVPAIPGAAPAAWPASLTGLPDTTFYVNDGAAASSNAQVIIRDKSVVNGRVNINAAGFGAQIGIDSSSMSSLSITTSGAGAQVWLGGDRIPTSMELELFGA